MRTSLTLFLLCLAFGVYAQTLGGSYPQPIRNSDTAVIKHVDWVQNPEILPDSTLEQLMRDIQAYKEPEMKNVSTAISPLYTPGEITVHTSVSPLGSTICEVPIELPKGRGECAPEISLCYTQFSGDGVLGWGWRLQGFSSINSVDFNRYYNDKTAPAVTDASAAFQLDGSQLVEQSSGWYRTEKGNIKVKCLTQGDKIVSFTVFRPDGSQSLYKPVVNDGLEYPLSRVTDVAGNHIDYTYEYKYGHHYLLSVSYGGRGPVDNPGHFVHVDFIYGEHRQDIPLSYTAGIEKKEPRLLQGIMIKLDTNIVKIYSMSYKNTTPSLLSEINCLAGSKTRLAPLRFAYASGNQGGIRQYTSSISLYYPDMKDLVVRSGKLSYGSDDDGIISYPDPGLYRNPQEEYYYVALDPSHKLNLYPGIGSNSAYALNFEVESGFNSAFCANIDYVPGDEIVRINSGVMSGKDVVRIAAYAPAYMNTGVDLKEDVYYFTGDAIKKKDTYSFCPKTYLSGDFTGDGKDEIFAVSMNAPLDMAQHKSVCYLFDLDQILSPVFQRPVFNYNMGADMVTVVDFDGDGKADICHIHPAGFDIYTFVPVNGDWQLNKIYSDNRISNSFLSDKRMLLSDVNGDAKTDFIISPEFVRTRTEYVPVYSPRECPVCHGHDFGYEGFNSMTGLPDVWCYTCEQYIQPGYTCVECGAGLTSDFTCPDHGSHVNYTWRTEDTQWQVLFSTGTEYKLESIPGFPVEKSDNLLMQDMDNDGILDIVCQKENKEVKIYPVRNNVIVYEPNNIVTATLSNPAILVPATVMQATNHLFLYGLYKNEVYKINYGIDQSQSRLLSAAYTSTGNEIRFSYQKMNSGYNYKIGQGAVFPYIDFTAPIWITTAKDGYSGGTLFESLQFSYEGGISHVQGLGFRGFKTVNTIDGLRSWYGKKIFDPTRYGILLKEETEQTVSDFEYDFVLHDDKTVKSLLLRKTEKDLLNDNTHITTYTYDDKENPIKEVVDYGDDLKTTIENTYQNIDTESKYYTGLLKTRTTTYSAPGQTDLRTSESYEYDDYQNLMYKSVVKGESSPVSEENYTYDEDQNMTAYDIQSYGSMYQITFYEYDAYGRPVKKTDPMNLITQWQYDIYGNMVRETNPEGLHTYYEYDGLGRTLRTVYPDSTETVVTYAWASGPESALTEITTTHTGKPTEKLFQDALGREVRKGAQRFDGHYLFTDKVYNQHGLLEKESLPFRSQSPSAWNQMTYDFHDRLVRTDYASGRTDVYDYGQNTVTETKKGITVSKTFDAVGRVIRVSDMAGDIQYTLRPDGQPESITAPGNITTTFTYNVYGQKIGMTDPSAGTIEWGYGPFGNQTYKKDANGVETRTLYDSYGRKDSIHISKDNKELRTVKFGYDNYNRLSQVVENTGSRFYKYDRYGRLSEDIQYIDDYFSLERKYAYNELGQISWINYYGYLPCTIGRVHYTYANGHKTEIKVDASAPAWKLVAENDMGLPVSIETGPLTRTFEYDRYGFPLKRTVTCGDRIIQDMSTRFDSHTGNLTWRQDNTRNIREDFSYDALNRLTGFNGKTITYDGKGNITDHSGVGSFEYAEDRPYAIEYITPYGDYVPEAAQEITYNELLRPQKIVEGDIETSFQYDYDGNFNYERIEGTDSLGKEFFREHFSWDNKYEELNGYHFGGVLYLDGDVFSATTAWCTSPIGGENEWEYLYICRDYMGSITHVIDKSGNVLQELSYDPWGRFRDPDTQELYAPGETPELLLLRGYCGHKHVEYHGLIHMNARLYDPVIGRFLSPDPYVQMPDFSQNFNRYTYCLNNPLVYKDENGEFIIAFFSHFIKGLVKK